MCWTDHVERGEKPLFQPTVTLFPFTVTNHFYTLKPLVLLYFFIIVTVVTVNLYRLIGKNKKQEGVKNNFFV